MDYSTELKEYVLPDHEYFIGKGKIKVTVVDAIARYKKSFGAASSIGFTSMFSTMNSLLGDSDHDFPTEVGQYQYIYTNKAKPNRSVSLMEMPSMGEHHRWEIYSDNELFDDIEWFSTKEAAEARILEVLL